jgi:cytochrome c551/c552
MIRVLKFAALVLVVFLVAAQAFRVDKTNPPVSADAEAPVPVKQVMTRACYACHSNETVWPWYSNVAPASWMVAYDVRKGRAELNFSQWGAYPQAKRLKKLKEIRDEIAEGEMPPWYYVYPMHPEARLSGADRAAINGWIASEEAGLK